MDGWIVVDRIENGLAACELSNREMKMLPLGLLPEGVREGDCLREINGRYLADPVETLRRREENLALLRDLTKHTEDAPSENGTLPLPEDGMSATGPEESEKSDGNGSDGFSLK